MPDPLVALETERLSVEPGGQTTVKARITNTSRIVDGFGIDVVGRGLVDWAETDRPEVRIMPNEEETVVVTFSPPGGPKAAGGTYPFGVRAISLTEADSSAVAEGSLTVGKIAGLHAKLTPVTSSGRWRGKHTIQITNGGNTPARVRPTGSDPDQALGFLIRPELLEIARNETEVARISVKGRRPFLRGTPVRNPFTIVGEPVGAVPVVSSVPAFGPALSISTPERPVAEGAFNQRPILPKFVIPLLLIIIAAAVAGVVYMFKRPLEPLLQLGDGRVPQVQGLTATPVDAHTIQLTWQRVAGIDGYFIQRYSAKNSPEKSEQAGKEDIALPVGNLPAATKSCFTVYALGPKPGPASEMVCAATLPEGSVSVSLTGSPQSPASPGGASGASPAAGPSGGSPAAGQPGGSPAAGQAGGSPAPSSSAASTPAGPVGMWVAAGEANSVYLPNVKERIAEMANKIRNETGRAAVLDTRNFGLDGYPAAPESYVVFSGPYSTRNEAVAACPVVVKYSPSKLCVPAVITQK